MSQEEVLVAEPPEDRDAGQSGIMGCLQVNIAIAHIDGVIGTDTQLTERLDNCIWSWFFADSFSFMFTNGNLDSVREEIFTKFFRCSIKLIADNSQTATALTKC